MATNNIKVIIDEDVKTEETMTQSSSDVNPSENVLERRGKHKLVMKKHDDSSTLSNKKKSVTGDSGNFSRKRKTADSSQEPPTSAERRETKSTEAISKPSHHLKRKRSDKIPHGPRRICLSSATAGGGNDVDDQIIEQSTQKTMTDFQYNNISARGRGGRDRGKTMGLVRVKPKNPSDTPICPTFSRGLPCNNAKCTFRHDVSTEASRPMCVFFQRNGMCSKGDDCPFKHVKISWDAEICPTFDKLGYCEDESCVLRHVACKKSKPNNAIDKR